MTPYNFSRPGSLWMIWKWHVCRTLRWMSRENRGRPTRGPKIVVYIYIYIYIRASLFLPLLQQLVNCWLAGLAGWPFSPVTTKHMFANTVLHVCVKVCLILWYVRFNISYVCACDRSRGCFAFLHHRFLCTVQFQLCAQGCISSLILVC